MPKRSEKKDPTERLAGALAEVLAEGLQPILERAMNLAIERVSEQMELAQEPQSRNGRGGRPPGRPGVSRPIGPRNVKDWDVARIKKLLDRFSDYSSSINALADLLNDEIEGGFTNGAVRHWLVSRTTPSAETQKVLTKIEGWVDGTIHRKLASLGWK